MNEARPQGAWNSMGSGSSLTSTSAPTAGRPPRIAARSRGWLDAQELEHGRRYIAVTVPITLLSQLTLYGLHGRYGLSAVLANLLAFTLLVGPQYLAYRYWVWASRDRAEEISREIVLFWLLGLTGLVVSTGTVWVAAQLLPGAVWVNAASLGGFGAVWAAKFFVLDRFLFADPDVRQPRERTV